jgi:hypothetical protein
MTDRITEDLADQQDGHIPARVPRAEHLTDEPTGGPRPLRPPARPPSVTLSRTAAPAITAPAFPGPPRPGKPAGQRADAGKCTLDSAMHVKSARGLRGPCPWLVRRRGPRPWPFVQSRRSRTLLAGPDSRPLYVRGHRDRTVHGATR